MPHIVDTLIEERAASLTRRAWLWALLRPVILPLMGYRKAIQAVDHVAGMNGLEIFEYVSRSLTLDTQVEGLEHVPRDGPAIVMPNHPSGIADGIAVYDALKGVRRDLIFFANRDAIRAAPGLADMIIPVEWVQDKRTLERRKETVKSMVRAFRDDRLVIIFPSGRLAQPTLLGLRERAWQTTAMNLAVKYSPPVVPMHIRGHNSVLYYLFYILHEELRDMTLFRELFNKSNARYQLTMGAAFDPRSMLTLYGEDIAVMTEQLRRFVSESMPRGEREFHAPSNPTNPVPDG